VREAIQRGYFMIYENKTNYKNKKARRAEIIPGLSKEIRKYIKNRKDYEWMFPSRKGNGHITVQSFSRILKEAGLYFGIDNLSSHSMRKTYAYKAYISSGKDIVIVKELLGHESIEWTKRYIGLSDERYHEVVSHLKDFIR